MTAAEREPTPTPTPSADAAHAAWTSELEAMEAYLSAQREAFSYRDVERPPLRDPCALDQLGPLPESLRPRAEELLRATRAFEGEMVDARASVATALRHAERGRRQRAAYVDARA
jgi:hypothetical protein